MVRYYLVIQRYKYNVCEQATDEIRFLLIFFSFSFMHKANFFRLKLIVDGFFPVNKTLISFIVIHIRKGHYGRSFGSCLNLMKKLLLFTSAKCKEIRICVTLKHFICNQNALFARECVILVRVEVGSLDGQKVKTICQNRIQT